MRSSEMAKDVLLHAAPIIMKEPTKLNARSKAGKFSGGMSALRRPKPKCMATVIAEFANWSMI